MNIIFPFTHLALNEQEDTPDGPLDIIVAQTLTWYIVSCDWSCDLSYTCLVISLTRIITCISDFVSFNKPTIKYGWEWLSYLNYSFI